MGGLVSLVVLGFDVWAIIDILKSSLDGAKKALWILLVLLLPIIGLALYLVIGRKR